VWPTILILGWELDIEAKGSGQPFQRERVNVDLQTKPSNQLQGQATAHRLAS
jgi:hypothetical protein